MSVRKLALLLCLLAASPTLAQDIKPYPGAAADTASSHQCTHGGTQCQVFTTPDSFDKLYAFYKGVYREAKWPVPAPTLPNGRQVQWAFFILDDGKDLAHAKHWMKIQHPYIGTISDDSDADFKDIRDLSVIQSIRKP
jgi:hypothetical protein